MRARARVRVRVRAHAIARVCLATRHAYRPVLDGRLLRVEGNRAFGRLGCGAGQHGLSDRHSAVVVARLCMHLVLRCDRLLTYGGEGGE